jgi:hypothetical protein
VLSSNVHLLLNCRTSKSQRRTTDHPNGPG